MRRSRSMSSADVLGISRERSLQIRRNQVGASFPRVHRCRDWRRARAVCFRRWIIFPPFPTGPSLLGSAPVTILGPDAEIPLLLYTPSSPSLAVSSSDDGAAVTLAAHRSLSQISI